MKKTKRRILGLLGLVLVATMTFVAATMPEHEAGAISTDTITDTVIVRVTGSVPNVFFTEPTSNVTTTKPAHNIGVAYENVSGMIINYEHTGASGTPDSGVFYAEDELEYIPGNRTLPINLLDYGYGKIVLSSYGASFDDVITPFDSIAFMFLPVIASADQNDENGLVDVLIEEYGADVETIEIYLDGVLMGTVTRKQLEAMTGDKIVSIDMGNRGSGDYTFDIVAKNSAGERLYLPYKTPFKYTVMPVPDTGRFFQNLNISKEDYLITGLITFFTLGIAAFVFIIKSSKKTKRTRK